METPEAIAALDSWLQQNRPAYYEALRPPLTDERIQHYERLFDFTLDRDIRLLYQWKNGQTALTDETLYGDRSWLQMEEIRYVVEPANELLNMGEFQEQDWWSGSWLPFLRDGAGGYLCVDLEGTFGGEVGQLIRYWEDRPDRTIEFPALSSFLSALVAGLEGDGTVTFPPGYPVSQAAR